MKNVSKVLRLQWDRAVAIAAFAGGALALLLGYLGVSNTPHVADQLPYFLSGGLFGLFLMGIGVGLWISADLRDEWRQLKAIRELLEDERDGAITSSDTWITSERSGTIA